MRRPFSRQSATAGLVALMVLFVGVGVILLLTTGGKIGAVFVVGGVVLAFTRWRQLRE